MRVPWPVAASVAVVVVSFGSAVALSQLSSEGSEPVQSVDDQVKATEVRATVCEEPVGSHFCDYPEVDRDRRVRLSEQEMEVDTSAAEIDVSTALDIPACVVSAESQQCREAFAPYRPSEEDVADVGAALAGLGYRDSSVRIARPGDPAPEGALLAAVPIGRLCLLSFNTGRHGSERAMSWVTGRLEATDTCI
ncbi:hypothetical protein [Actinoplanes subglobosus]|uniref:PASTA domain-containing protein n=1 Tax=Actinoplanes subglobosus TaxID=1547892 RepID=A0ABV8IX16_9ACTN